MLSFFGAQPQGQGAVPRQLCADLLMVQKPDAASLIDSACVALARIVHQGGQYCQCPVCATIGPAVREVVFQSAAYPVQSESNSADLDVGSRFPVRLWSEKKKNVIQVFDGIQRVPPYIPLVRRTLFDALHGCGFGNDVCEEIKLVQRGQRGRWACCVQNLEQFIANPFGRNGFQAFCI
jgi:hypothetical protein